MKSSFFISLALAFVFFYSFDSGKDVYVNEIAKLSDVKSLQKVLDRYYTDEKLGSFVSNGKTYFRLFAPSAARVELWTFKTPSDTPGNYYPMIRKNNGVWETKLTGERFGMFYGFRVYSKEDLLNKKSVPLCVDPYAKAVATYTDYLNPRKAIVYKDNFNWEDDKWIQRDWRDLIIYEMHIRDMTAHPSSGAKHPGSYQGMVEENIRGGLNYIKKLGVNTVEILPAMEYGYMEIPYLDSLDGFYNTWNPYERNHWGYMTSNFFAPASYYSYDWKSLKRHVWIGTDARQINDFKKMVKAFHKAGIGVMMDVVFNHLSEYEMGNLKQIDKTYYFRLRADGNFESQSYCGNDLRTEAPMMRRLIVESVLYWMSEFHIDGFRFDLGKLIDWKTIETVIAEARKLNPYVVFVCEPWGGGYDPTGFSQRGWGAWNDQIRNGIKGQNPINGQGWIFGKWYGNNNIKRIESYVNGTLLKDKGGLFYKKEHSVNYLESHDDYTLGDFIRIGSGEVKPNAVIKNVKKHGTLSERQLKLNKLAALFLLTSQGITMISEGQEFARSKVIPWNISVPDKHKGQMDHNSYNKDNSTNYLDYEFADLNRGLVEYYKGLILLRKTFPAFRRAAYEDIKFHENSEFPFALAYTVKYGGKEFFVAFNAEQKRKVSFDLPDGTWEILVNKDIAGIEPLGTVKNRLYLPPVTGAVLKLEGE